MTMGPLTSVLGGLGGSNDKNDSQRLDDKGVDDSSLTGSSMPPSKKPSTMTEVSLTMPTMAMAPEKPALPMPTPDPSENAKKSESFAAKLVKYTSLFILVVMLAVKIMYTRYATVQPHSQPFLKSALVFWAEVAKFVSALTIFMLFTGPIWSAPRRLYQQFCWLDTLKLGVPAFVYTVQNFLFLAAMEHLEASTFSVLDQLKILTTALFTVLIMRRRLSLAQWASLVILLAGVIIVQYNAQQDVKAKAKGQALNGTALLLNGTTASGNGTSALHQQLLLHNATMNSINNINGTELNKQQMKTNFDHSKQRPLYGLICVVAGNFMSGFAGVYIEKMLKSRSQVSIWLQNVQLAALAIPISMAMVAIQDWNKVLHNGGLNQGFDLVVWGVVATQTMSGLCIAMVIKYADNILKTFANSFATIVISIASIWIFSNMPKPLFVLGAALIISAALIYARFPYRRSNKPVAIMKQKPKPDQEDQESTGSDPPKQPLSSKLSKLFGMGRSPTMAQLTPTGPQKF